nr:MAG TPA: hypothetical protein [Caudoviricetes sp.]DAR97026.1 MAG TPA: hypothetical protein [Caudoviricetes sp.]
MILYNRIWPCLHTAIPCTVFFGVSYYSFISCNVLVYIVS